MLIRVTQAGSVSNWWKRWLGATTRLVSAEVASGSKVSACPSRTLVSSFSCRVVKIRGGECDGVYMAVFTKANGTHKLLHSCRFRLHLICQARNSIAAVTNFVTAELLLKPQALAFKVRCFAVSGMVSYYAHLVAGQARLHLEYAGL